MKQKIIIAAFSSALALGAYLLFLNARQDDSIGRPSNAKHEAPDAFKPSDQSVRHRTTDVESEKRAPQKVAFAVTAAGSEISALWIAYSNSESATKFYRQYKDHPLGSTERFMAEYKRLSCGSLTTIGVEKYLEYAERRRRALPPNQLEDALQKAKIERYIQQCTDQIGRLTANEVVKALGELMQGSSSESKALALQRQALERRDPTELLRDAGEVVAAGNPFVAQAMAQVWRSILEHSPNDLKNSVFQGVQPLAAEAAWVMASCSFGMDCSANNELIVTECVQTRRCNFDSVPSFYQRYVLSPEDYARATQVQEQIQLAIRSRDLRPLGITGR